MTEPRPIFRSDAVRHFQAGRKQTAAAPELARPALARPLALVAVLALAVAIVAGRLTVPEHVRGSAVAAGPGDGSVAEPRRLLVVLPGAARDRLAIGQDVTVRDTSGRVLRTRLVDLAPPGTRARRELASGVPLRVRRDSALAVARWPGGLSAGTGATVYAAEVETGRKRVLPFLPFGG